MRFVVELPWPDKALSPNSKPHWAKKAKAVKAAKEYAFYSLCAPSKPNWERVKLHWVFHPKTRHLIDDDNAEASCKAYRDGLALALGIDDKHFKATREIAEPIKGGKVIAIIEELK